MFTWQIGLALLLLVIVSLISGYMLGKTITTYKHNKEFRGGAFIINTSDPQKDVVRFELDVSLGEFMSKKHVLFDVKHEDENGEGA